MHARMYVCVCTYFPHPKRTPTQERELSFDYTQRVAKKRAAMASEAGACQTRNMGSYEDEEEDEKQAAPLDEVGVVMYVCRSIDLV